MAPVPRRQNPQHQPLTVSLRKICRDYPAGTGILRELLQNADDAGASTVKFILDTREHSESPVLVDGLSQYQGPALLAYNDALFSENDFRSLASLGDSGKINVKAATGKFGLGFSSVYNWTDCPSILSGSTLQFLDPHHSWSRIFDPPGGPDYDFPASSEDKAMVNQLECFSHINTQWDCPFEGTVIRIPLRNASQASLSKISSKETSNLDIQKSMASFANEMGSNGLLFLKSVRKIVLSIDHQRLDEIEMHHDQDLTRPERKLKGLLDNITNDGDLAGGETYHEVRLQHWSANGEYLKTYGILNLVMGSAADPSLDGWAASENLFPWVAVAAQMMNHESEIAPGRLYSVLPLPILTGMPVHIHGLFSVSTDRSRLHGLDDEHVQDARSESWNKFLFSQMIPRAWAKLLLKICEKHEAQDLFHIWPTPIADARQWCSGMSRRLMDFVSQNDDPVWYTEFGNVSFSAAILASVATEPWQKAAFREVAIPIVYLVERLHEEVCQIPGSRALCPEVIYDYLRRNPISQRISSQSRLAILDFLRTQLPLTDLAGLEIFPFKNGSFRSLSSKTVFLPRDTCEQKLFEMEPENNLATDQLSEPASTWLHKQVESSLVVRYRTIADLCDYFVKHIAHGSGDALMFDDTKRSMLDQVWRWIMRHCQGDLSLSVLGSLWLIPLHGSRVRKLVPTDASSSITWFDHGKGKEVALKLLAVDPVNGPNVMMDDALTNESLQYLRSLAKSEKSLHVRDGGKFEGFLGFLEEARICLRNITEDVQDSAFQILKELYILQSDVNCVTDVDKMRSLRIFKEIQWSSGSSAMTRSSIDLTTKANITGMKKLVPVPVLPNQIFLDATDEWACRLFEKSTLAPCLDEIQILEKIVIPAIVDSGYEHMIYNLRVDVAELLCQNYFRLSPFARDCFPTMSFVPLKKRDGDEKLSFACPLDLVDPAHSTLVDLYFEDELAQPDESFCRQYSGVLASCGMVSKPDKRFILGRIRAYEKKQLPLGVVASKAQKLLEMPISEDISQQKDLSHIAQSCAWLPCRNQENSYALTSSVECRDVSEQPLVGRVWNTLPFKVESSWRSMLGWCNPIQVDVLISQLAKSIAETDFHSVEQTLLYLDELHTIEDYLEQLLKLSFVQTRNGLFVRPAQTSRDGAERLTPFLYNVDMRFWERHATVLSHADIPEIPDLEQLRRVQDALILKQPLEEADVDIAVEVARMWSSQPATSFQGLKGPDENGLLIDVNALLFNDAPWVTEVNCTTAHSKLPRSIADQLNMRPLSDLLRNGELGISDVDEDEFSQREEVTDGIRDTLDRYLRESTFYEYIANADDCSSASAINFLFDHTSYGTEHLLTTEMDSLQGPALLIHNDGAKVFTDSDFEGLKHVGRGSKRDDPTSIGKFGRGSQTMYHWTDVPMILSGQYLLILDPLQQHLPFNYRTKQKKPGVKIEYSKLKANCSDQLAPFEDLWGFNSERSFYSGTIFRFPLRSEGAGSDLIESLHCPDSAVTVQIFQKLLDEARLTLLFLRNISCIDFCIRQDANVKWRVSRGDWPESGTFSDWADVFVEYNRPNSNIFRMTERWWRVMVDINDAPANLQYRHKRRMKYVECGIAAQVPTHGEATDSLSRLKSKFFNCVPLKFESTLPVQVHASFLLSGDRQNIAIEETSRDAGSDWNKWLLREKLPQVYLQFLEDMGRKIGNKVYDYFPVNTKNGEQSLSELVRTAFWAEIRLSDRRIFPVVEPAGIEQVKKSSESTRNRRAPRMEEASHAVFDILDRQRSNAFHMLLSNSVKSFVRPPMSFHRYLRSASQFSFVTPSLVRNVLQSKESTLFVKESMQRDSDFLSDLLSFIIPQTERDYAELNNCTILPLMDGKLGTLILKTDKFQPLSDQIFYSASARCKGLFSFALSNFSRDKANREFVEKLLDSERFNLKKFEKNDINVVLTCKKTWDINEAMKEWLLDFWNYMNSTSKVVECPGESEASELEGLRDFPLLLIRQGGTETLTSLDYFRNNPAILSSCVAEHEDLYGDFPELGIVSSRTVPQKYCEVEKSLRDLGSMNRFIKSLEMLANKSPQSMADFVSSRLKANNVKTLRAIMTGFGPKIEPSLPDSANDLPLWRSVASEHRLLTAREALVAQDPAFVVPWMKDYLRFTEDHILCQKQRIDNTRLLEHYILPDLPQRIDDINKASYLRLVNAISDDSSLKQKPNKKKKIRHFIIPLKEHCLAARSNGELCLASALYDHSDMVFAASFRLTASDKFLMPEIRRHLSFWHEIGLHRREFGKFKDVDYLACLQTLECRFARPADPSLAADVRVILHPLCADDSSLNDLDLTTWSAIAKLNIFPVVSTLEGTPTYRRGQIEYLASQRNTLSLENIIRREYDALCWSQIPFSLPEPSSSSIKKARLKSQPSCAMVWEHLKFLAETAKSIEKAEIESFVNDLQKTYEFLHLNQQESKNTFNDKLAAIWWNAETTDSSRIDVDVLQSSWTSLENLILDSPCHAPPLMTVNTFLGRFSSLLKELGCKSLYFPPVASPSEHRSEPALVAVRQLREEGILNDVRFEAEGIIISAHKVILASRSLYCKNQFHGPWALQSDTITNSEPIRLEDMAHSVLKILVEYCYHDHLDWAVSVHVQEEDDLSMIAEKLDTLLDVLVAADRWVMPDLHLNAQEQLFRGIRVFVRPDNVKQVEKVASEANAEEVRRYCEEYIIENAEAVLLANAEDDEGGS